MSFTTINPSTGQSLNSYSFDSLTLINKKLEQSLESFLSWHQEDIQKRIGPIKKLKTCLLENIDEAAHLMSLEMGKPINESKAEIKKCTLMIQYYCDNASIFLTDDIIDTHFKKSYVTYQAQGPILGIMPWNFPFWQVLRFSIPAMIAGNTVLIKHAPNVQGTQNFLQEIVKRSDLPKGVFTTVIVDTPDIEMMIADDKIRGVSFTGSEKVGRTIGALAGKNLKKCVLELGGNDAYIVLPDAHLEKAARACVTSRFINNGQSCVAAKRWIVHQEIKSSFSVLVKKYIEKLQMGDALQSENQIGPMARQDLKEQLDQQVSSSIEMGAKVLTGGPNDPRNKGCFYPPTLLDHVAPGQPAFEEELFGPVASMITAKTTEHAIELANQSKYGLGGALFSSNEILAEKIAKHRLDTGGVFINDFYKSIPELPFGGVKASGIGRELSKHALYEFVNIKTIALV